MIALTTLLAKTLPNWLTSCRLAPVTTTDNGTPRPSTRIWRFVPFFSSIRGVGSGTLFGQRCLVHAAIYRLPFPSYPFQIVIFGQTTLPKLQEKAFLLPFSEISMNCTRTPNNIFGQCFPLNPSSQHINNRGKDLARLKGLSSSANLASILLFFISPGRRYQWLYYFPEGIRHFP